MKSLRTLARTGALITATIGLAGCGAAAKTTAAPPLPKLPSTLAQSWARQADAVAASIAAGDGCLAQTQAVALRTQVAGAINTGRIARRFVAALLTTVNDLPLRIPCAPAPAPPGKSKHGHKDHGKNGGGD